MCHPYLQRDSKLKDALLEEVEALRREKNRLEGYNEMLEETNKVTVFAYSNQLSMTQRIRTDFASMT